METTTTTDIDRIVRVGSDYYKLVKVPTPLGTVTEEYRRWSYRSLVEDHGKDALSHVRKYDGFMNIPDNINHKREHGAFLNLSDPMVHKPATDGPHDCGHTLNYLREVFAERSEEALDYLQLALAMPGQRLPVLYLTGPRGSGKTTLLKYLHTLFEGASYFMMQDEMAGDFNAQYIAKQLVCIDGAVATHQFIEHLRRLNSTHKMVRNAKGADQVTMDWFGKLVVGITGHCAVDQDDPCAWVVPMRYSADYHQQHERNLVQEIPHFLAHLLQRQLHTKAVSRYWFAPLSA